MKTQIRQGCFKPSHPRSSMTPVTQVTLPRCRKYFRFSALTWSDRFPEIHPSCPVLILETSQTNRTKGISRPLNGVPVPRQNTVLGANLPPAPHKPFCRPWTSSQGIDGDQRWPEKQHPHAGCPDPRLWPCMGVQRGWEQGKLPETLWLHRILPSGNLHEMPF